MKTKSTAPGSTELARAIAQLQAASNNLSTVAANSGDDRARSASRLISQVRLSLVFGDCYPTVDFAEAFDKIKTV